MTPAARIAAAIEVLEDIETRRRPAAEALKDWGLSHRFAGSKDRSAIASLVYDALRVRASAAWIMGEDTPRAIMLGALKRGRGMETQAIAALCGAGPHAPPELTEAERQRLDADDLTGAPDHVQGDYPEWLAEAFQAAFGDQAVAEGRALAERAPVDLRANLLKTSRDKALATLAHLNAQATTLSPWGLRIAVGADGRGPALSAEPAYAKGQVEVQDEASQLAALIAGAKPGWQVLDLCAGAGGKSLALAAMMENKGQVLFPTATVVGSCRSTTGWSGPGCATCRCARPRPARWISPISKSAAISCSSMRPVRAPARGGATRTPNGARAPARWNSARSSRTRCCNRRRAM